MNPVFLGGIGEWWTDPRQQYKRRVAMTTETTVNIDLVWDTDTDLANATELVMKELGHHHGNQSMVSFNVAVQQPVGSAVAGSYSVVLGTAVPVQEGYGKKYQEPGLRFRKVDGNVRLILTLSAAQNPGDFWVVFHRN